MGEGGADGRRGGLAGLGVAGARSRPRSLARAALRPRGPSATTTAAACVLRAASVALAAPRELATLRSRRRHRLCDRLPAQRLCDSALRSPQLTPVLYLERAEPSSQRTPPARPLARPPSLARSLSRATRPAHLPPARGRPA